MADAIMTTEVTSTTFPDLVIEKSKSIPVLVDFWADWCAPCKMLMPVLTNVVAEFSGKIDLVKVNTDQESQLAGSYNVRSLPTIKLFKDGQVVDEFMGALPERAVREFIEKHLDRAADKQIRSATTLSKNGRHEDAIKILAGAISEDPSYDKIRLALANEQIEAGHLDDARLTLDELPSELRLDTPVKSILARLELAELANGDIDIAHLEERLSQYPDDLSTRAQLGAAYFLAGEHESAMTQWLEVVRRGDNTTRNSGRENLIRTFEVLGSSNEHVVRYRRLLAQALN